MKSFRHKDSGNTGQRMRAGPHDHIRFSIFFRIASRHAKKACEKGQHIFYPGDPVSLIFSCPDKDKGNPFLLHTNIRLPMCIHCISGLVQLIGRKNRSLYSFFLQALCKAEMSEHRSCLRGCRIMIQYPKSTHGSVHPPRLLYFLL